MKKCFWDKKEAEKTSFPIEEEKKWIGASFASFFPTSFLLLFSSSSLDSYCLSSLLSFPWFFSFFLSFLFLFSLSCFFFSLLSRVLDHCHRPNFHGTRSKATDLWSREITQDKNKREENTMNDNKVHDRQLHTKRRESALPSLIWYSIMSVDRTESEQEWMYVKHEQWRKGNKDNKMPRRGKIQRRRQGKTNEGNIVTFNKTHPKEIKTAWSKWRRDERKQNKQRGKQTRHPKPK